MQTKNIICGLVIGLIATLGVALVGGAILDSITNTNTGTVANPIEIDFLDVYIDQVNITDSGTVDWGTFTVGANTKQVQIFNKEASLIRAFLYVTDLPTGWLVTFANATYIASTESFTSTLTITVPDTAIDGTSVSFSTQWTAETV